MTPTFSRPELNALYKAISCLVKDQTFEDRESSDVDRPVWSAAKALYDRKFATPRFSRLELKALYHAISFVIGDSEDSRPRFESSLEVSMTTAQRLYNKLRPYRYTGPADERAHEQRFWRDVRALEALRPKGPVINQ